MILSKETTIIVVTIGEEEEVAAKEKHETESMRLLEDEQKQRTAMELLEQYMQFKQEAEKDGKKNK